MKTRIPAAILVALPLLAAGFTVHAAPAERSALLASMHRILFLSEIPSQTQLIAHGAGDEEKKAVGDAVSDWISRREESIRRDLETEFGPEARARIQSFTEDYIRARAAADATFLAKLSAETGLVPPPPNYDKLQEIGAQKWLSADVEEAAQLMADIGVWLDAKRRGENVPALRYWLNRASPAVAAASLAASHATTAATGRPAQSAASPGAGGGAPSSTVDTLRQAELVAPLPPVATGTEAPNPLDQLTTAREAKRDKAFIQSMEGMKQVDLEREVVEKEVTARKKAELEAETARMKILSEQLAKNQQKEILEKKSLWSGKLADLAGKALSKVPKLLPGPIGLVTDLISNIFKPK